MNRYILSILAIIIIQIGGFSQEPEVGFRKFPYLIYPGNPEQMTVLWQTEEYDLNQYNIQCTISWGENTNYGTGSETLSNANGEDDYQYIFTIDDLTSQTKYYYKIIINNLTLLESVEEYSDFITAPTEDVDQITFYDYGDTQGSSASPPGFHDPVCEAIMNEVAADENSQTFLLHTGDWNNEDTEYKWDRDYFNTTHLNALELKSKMSVMGSRGNHEGTGSIFKKYWPYYYPGTNTGFCHFMDYGPVHVCFIDLQTESSTLDQYKRDWIESDLSSTEKDWKVLVFHSPLYSNGGHVNNIAEQEYLQSLCINYGVQIVLCGHNHYYAHWLVNGIHHLTSGGGGAETSEPTTGIGEILADKINHFIKFSIVDDLMNVNIIDYEGNHIEDFTLPKSLRICNNEHIIWNEDITYADKIRICAGSTLSINSTVSFVEEGSIIVEAGGKLELNGGTLTSANPEMPWQGIEVWGNPTLSQIPANQGWLEIINGGTIENAVVAVRAGSADYTGKGGGIVSAEDAVFLNNTVSAMFDPYTAYTNTSAFGSCTFNYTKTISGEPELYFAKLNNVISVQFNNCTFTNNSNQDRIGIGIESINSIFSVEGMCTEYSGTECIEWDNGLFENLEYGVYATASTTTRFADIRHTTFTDNLHGIYLGGMTLPRVTSNEFHLNRTADMGGYGLYLDGSTQYWVEDNSFNGNNSNLPTGIGIYVNASGSLANEIYLNSFDYIEYAVTVLGYNRNSRTTTTGLQIRCNYYDHTLFDETIVHDGPFLPGSDGIASIQGSNSTNVEDMAGNIFYYETSATDYDDLNNQSNHFYYYYSSNAGGYRVEPMDYTVSTVTIVPKSTPLWNYEGGCPSNLPTGGGGGIEGLRSAMIEAQSNIVNTETVLLALVDGGDTEALNAEIETSTPPETSEIYNELMTGSPYLSETVVGTAIDKEEVLPNSMVRDVMVANPHTSTSLQLLDKLNDRTNPMPAWMKAQILAGRSITSLKTELEGQLAGYQTAKCRAMNSLARYFGQQPENPVITDSLIALYQSDNTLSSRYMQAWLYLNSGQYQQGQNVMASIPANFTLAGDELTEYQNIQWLYTMLKGLLESGNGLDDLSEAQIAQLNTIVADETDFASVYARNILLAIDELEYQEPIILPNSMKSAEVEEAYHEALNSQAPTILEVYPNPSKDYVILGYQFDKDTKGMIEIRDISGKPVQSIPFNGIQNQVTVTTHGWSTGVYVLNLVVNDKVIETTKFTLVK